MALKHAVEFPTFSALKMKHSHRNSKKIKLVPEEFLFLKIIPKDFLVKKHDRPQKKKN